MINNGNNNNQNAIIMPAQIPAPREPFIRITWRNEYDDRSYYLYFKIRDINIPYIGGKNNLPINEIETLENMQKNIIKRHETFRRNFYLSIGGSTLITFFGLNYASNKYTVPMVALGGITTYTIWNTKKANEEIKGLILKFTNNGIDLKEYFDDENANQGYMDYLDWHLNH